MGKKAEVGTPKWLGNKMKSKGLQKLRWYCQMCNKQCRDENGFKCHTQSESHQRQLLLFADSPMKFLGEFSHEFESGFINLLKRRFGTKRVHANQVYQEYIRDKDHVHMNGTRWSSLTGFCMYLGKTGKAVVDETEKGWYIAWIDRDPETIARQEALAKRDKMNKDDEERLTEFISQQIERDKKKESDESKEKIQFIRDSDDKITVNLRLNKKKSETIELDKNIFKVPISVPSSSSKNPSFHQNKRPSSSLQEIKEEIAAKIKREENERERLRKETNKQKNDKSIPDSWLRQGITVKIITKTLGDKYYKEKGVVKEVIEKYGAVVVLASSNAKIKLDQEHLETVIPALGRKVLILHGDYTNCEAILKKIDIENFKAELELIDGGQSIFCPYEHFSKYSN